MNESLHAADARASAREITRGVPRRQWNSIVGRPGDYQADIIFFRYSESEAYRNANSGMSCALVMIEIPTRYAYVVEMPNKTASIVAVKMDSLVNHARRDGHPVINLTTDDGPEFANKVFREHRSHDWRFTHWIKEVGDLYSLGIIDRFCRTIKEWVEKWQIQQQSMAWTQAISLFLHHYNNARNRGIGFTPNELRGDQEKQDLSITGDFMRGSKGREKFYQLARLVSEGQVSEGHIAPKVRIRIRPGVLEKGSEHWSNKVYTITGVEGYSFKLQDSAGRPEPRDYRAHELMLVSQDSVDVPDIFEEALRESRMARRARACH